VPTLISSRILRTPERSSSANSRSFLWGINRPFREKDILPSSRWATIHSGHGHRFQIDNTFKFWLTLARHSSTDTPPRPPRPFLNLIVPSQKRNLSLFWICHHWELQELHLSQDSCLQFDHPIERIRKESKVSTTGNNPAVIVVWSGGPGGLERLSRSAIRETLESHSSTNDKLENIDHGVSWYGWRKALTFSYQRKCFSQCFVLLKWPSESSRRARRIHIICAHSNNHNPIINLAKEKCTRMIDHSMQPGRLAPSWISIFHAAIPGRLITFLLDR
jgi:hypothetical protein